MIQIKNNSKCCGCSACFNACPKQCIAMVEDAEGFKYPFISQELCVNCGLCENVCPELNPFIKRVPFNVYAAFSKNEEIRMKSSSGGIFFELSSYILSQHGIVFGVKLDENWNAVMSYTSDINGVYDFMGSKYVQCDIGRSYIECEQFLKKGKIVLFTGTPCHISALKCFLKKDYSNLYTVDVACHGVPSPGIWRDYICNIRETARKGKNSVSSSLTHDVLGHDALDECGSMRIESISFRDKRKGWKKYSFALTLAEASADGKQNTVSLSQSIHEHPYLKAFVENIILRPSCYSCQFKCGKSNSDITISDFWGVKKFHPEMDDDKGTSTVMIYTYKGFDLLRNIDLKMVVSTYLEATYFNTAIIKPHKCHINRKRFFKEYGQEDDLQLLVKRCLELPTYIKIIEVVNKFINLVIRRIYYYAGWNFNS